MRTNRRSRTILGEVGFRSVGVIVSFVGIAFTADPIRFVNVSNNNTDLLRSLFLVWHAYPSWQSSGQLAMICGYVKCHEVSSQLFIGPYRIL